MITLGLCSGDSAILYGALTLARGGRQLGSHRLLEAALENLNEKQLKVTVSSAIAVRDAIEAAWRRTETDAISTGSSEQEGQAVILRDIAGRLAEKLRGVVATAMSFDVTYYEDQSRFETWELTGCFCPNCGEKHVWIRLFVNDGKYPAEETHLCVACESVFLLPGGIMPCRNTADDQAIKAIKMVSSDESEC